MAFALVILVLLVCILIWYFALRKTSNKTPPVPTAEGRADSPTTSLGPFVVLDGAGWAPTIGSSGYLYVYADRIALGMPGRLSTLPLDSLTDVRVSGQSVISGGGFFGGGFGPKGAVEGMLISTVLNGLTTKKSKRANNRHRRKWGLGRPSTRQLRRFAGQEHTPRSFGSGEYKTKL